MAGVVRDWCSASLVYLCSGYFSRQFERAVGEMKSEMETVLPAYPQLYLADGPVVCMRRSHNTVLDPVLWRQRGSVEPGEEAILGWSS
jgi:hypothetical protein